MYCCLANSASNFSSCSALKIVRTRFDRDEELDERGELAVIPEPSPALKWFVECLPGDASDVKT